MSSLFPIDFNLDFAQSGQNPVITPSDCATGCSDKLFQHILADENLVSDIMAQLKEALPDELYAQIEEMVQSGNGLPLAAIFSMESPLFKQDMSELPQFIQDAVMQNGGQISDIVASALKSGEARPQTLGGEQTGRTMDNLVRSISDSLAQVSTKSEDTSTAIGKQIQELLTSTKAELVAAGPGSKVILPTSSSSDGLVTSNIAIGTAINGLAQLSNFQVNSGLPSPPPITVPMGEEAWGQAMGERIMWMMGKGIQGASIRINPPELGPIQVQLSVKNDQASVHMLVQHGVVKEALDASIPRLRDMLHESNMHLVNVDVSHRESPDQSSSSWLYSQDQREQMERFIQDQEMATQIEEEVSRYHRSTGLLDDYA